MKISVYHVLLISSLLFSVQVLPAQNGSGPLHGLRVDVVYLSSDYLQGRETGKEGELLAATYIADRFEKIGLEPAGTDGSYFQSFDFNYSDNPHVATDGEDRTGRNVAAFLDNQAASTVVIGAHYDHLGQGIFGSLHTGGAAIHNGADDNASGVAAMLHLAEQLKSGKAKNNNYLFIGFSGEELGLYGSKYFTNNPTIDLGEVNYMLNMDMVGRLNEEKVLAVNGAGTSPAWKEVLESIDVGGISVKASDSGVGPSDHTAFYLKDIPVLHFFTGQHTDYHKPSDDAALVNFEGLQEVATFILTLIEKLDENGRLAFTKTKDDAGDRKVARFKVTLGVMPDYVYQGEGMRIDAVSDDRPGQKAGLKGGDVIIRIGDLEVKDIYDYMEGLAKFKTGDKTTIVVKRGEEVIEKLVEF